MTRRQAAHLSGIEAGRFAFHSTTSSADHIANLAAAMTPPTEAETERAVESSLRTFIQEKLRSMSFELENWIDRSKDLKLDKFARTLEQILHHTRIFDLDMYSRNDAALYKIVKERHEYIKKAMNLLSTRQNELDDELCTFLDVKKQYFGDKLTMVS